MSSRKQQDYCDPRVLFMYLMTERVRDGWDKQAIGDRSLSLPFGEIERFAIPGNLVTDGKPRKSSKSSGKADDYTSQVIDAFENRQAKLERVSELDKEMNEGLQRVWDISWSLD